MKLPKNHLVAVRLAETMKIAVTRIAAGRFTTESEICREAILEYLTTRGFALQTTTTNTVITKENQ